MDPKDYHITVSELFDRIEASLRRQAVEGIEPLRADDRLVLQFEDLREILLTSDAGIQRVDVAFDAAVQGRFAYHEVEEEWLDVRTQDPLPDLLNRVLAVTTGVPATIPRDDLM